MPIPIISSVIGFIGEKVLWRLLRFTVKRLSKTFVGKYKPDVHAKKSRRWEWDKAWYPMILKATKTPNPLDDSAVRYMYFHQACYIEDGTLIRLLKDASESVEMGHSNQAGSYLKKALELIDLDEDAHII